MARILSASRRFINPHLAGCLFLTLTFAGRAVIPQTNPQRQTFEVASIHLVPNHSLEELMQGKGLTSISPYGTNAFTARNATLDFLIQVAYGVEQNQIVGEPDWMTTQAYDITAKASRDAGLSREQMQPLLQHLLEDRFHLVFHRETKEFKGYALVIAKGGPRLTEAKGTQPGGQAYDSGIDAKDVPLAFLASILAIPLKSHTIDKTALDGNYDFHLRFAPDGASDSPYSSIFTALQDEYGLKLEPQTIPIETLIIDHVDKVPTEN